MESSETALIVKDMLLELKVTDVKLGILVILTLILLFTHPEQTWNYSFVLWENLAKGVTFMALPVPQVLTSILTQIVQVKIQQNVSLAMLTITVLTGELALPSSMKTP
jgi:hypothetical protein